jgi:hypothetical protein
VHVQVLVLASTITTTVLVPVPLLRCDSSAGGCSALFEPCFSGARTPTYLMSKTTACPCISRSFKLFLATQNSVETVVTADSPQPPAAAACVLLLVALTCCLLPYMPVHGAAAPAPCLESRNEASAVRCMAGKMKGNAT